MCICRSHFSFQPVGKIYETHKQSFLKYGNAKSKHNADLK